MELRINLASASLKDAEHAIFLIGAYFGMTALPHIADVNKPGMGLAPVAASVNADGTVTAPGFGTVTPTPAPAPAPTSTPPEGATEVFSDPAATFGAAPAPLPQGAGESPMAADPAQVFANGATGPATPSLPATVVPSAPVAAAPVAGDAGNAAGVVGGPVGSPSAVTTAPVPSSSSAPTAPAGVELDATGLPWDSRIHASGENGAKPKNADGKWRKKRGLNDAALIARVEQELRATLAAPAVAPGTPPAAPAPAPVVVTPPPAPPAPPVAPVAPQAPAPAAAPQADPQTFEALMPRITAAVMAGTLPNTALLQACNAYGVTTIPSLATRPDLVPTIWAYLRSMYPALV